MALGELASLCRRRGFRLKLELVDPTGHQIRSEPSSSGGSLRVRVLDRDGQVLAGRIQSEPGLERIEDPAEGVLQILYRRGLVV